MKNVLVVSPRFPPTSAADLHRVRIGLRYFEENGWRPHVLAIDSALAGHEQDPMLLETLPARLTTTHIRALPERLTRKAGLGDLGIRAFPFLYAAGTRIIKDRQIDLVYFSTTAFVTMALGRLWKAQSGTPYVLDIQDPWLSDYYDNKPRNQRPPKYWLSQRLHRTLEPWTMKEVDGLIAVSDAYIETLKRRYSWLAERRTLTLPFGASETDFEILKSRPQANRFFSRSDGSINGVYVGRGGSDMSTALGIIFAAFRKGLSDAPDLFSRVKLYFIGTDYAGGDRARPTVSPVAAKFGLDSQVEETTSRVPYFESLQLMLDADFLLLPGSDDPQYTASKIYPCILSRKPLLAVFHERSSVCDVLRKTKCGTVFPFSDGEPGSDTATRFFKAWTDALKRLPFVPDTDWEAFEPYSAREMTRRQCNLFDQVLSAGSIELEDESTSVRSAAQPRAAEQR
jgi:hypothetical protein